MLVQALMLDHLGELCFEAMNYSGLFDALWLKSTPAFGLM